MRSRRPSRGGALSDTVLLLFVVASTAVAPRLMEGYGAFEWTRYYVARGTAPPRAAENARKAARAATRAIDLGAPLPWAVEAARLALGLGRNLEPSNRILALELYMELRSALDGARASRFRDLGLGGVAREALELEETARARPATGAKPP